MYYHQKEIRSGGVIKGQDVYFEVTGKVVNGIEEYTQGTYRRNTDKSNKSSRRYSLFVFKL